MDQLDKPGLFTSKVCIKLKEIQVWLKRLWDGEYVWPTDGGSYGTAEKNEEEWR